MRKLAALLAVFWVAWTVNAGDAHAQSLPFDWQNEVPDANDNFTRCMHRDRANAERTIRSCGRVISERAGSAYTAAAHYSRGLMREMLQDRESARDDFNLAYRFFTIAIDSSDGHTDAYRNRAAALYRLERYPEAIADYEQALAVVANARSGPGTRVRSGLADLRRNQIANLHYRIGGVHFRAGNWQAASDAFDQAANLSPENPNYQGARCEVRAAADVDPEGARAACAAAITFSDGSDEAIFSLGFLLFSQDDFAAAYQAFSRAYEIDVDNILARYARGVTAVRLGQSAGAAEMEAAAQLIDASALAYYTNAGLRPEP